MQLLDSRFSRAGYPKTVEYTESDFPDKWKKAWKNRKAYKTKEYYYQIQQNINYSLNSLGYREKEFDKIDWNTSYVFLGCSHTFGVGVKEHETIPAQIQTKTGINCINLGIPGGCNMFSLFNSSTIKNTGVAPLKIFYQRTYPNRWFSFDKELSTRSISKYIDNSTANFIDLQVSSAIKAQWPNLVEYSLEIFDDCGDIKYIARDGCHYNSRYFEKITNLLCDKYI